MPNFHPTVGDAIYVQPAPSDHGSGSKCRYREELVRMLRRAATMGAAVGGWVGALAMAGLSLTGWVDNATAQTLSRLLMGVGLMGAASLALRRHQRPLGAAFELGYEMGRRDAIREATKRSNVTPIRRAKGGLSEFNRSVGL